MVCDHDCHQYDRMTREKSGSSCCLERGKYFSMLKNVIPLPIISSHRNDGGVMAMAVAYPVIAPICATVRFALAKTVRDR